MKGDKSDSKADNMLDVEKKANEVKMEPVILSDSEEERVDPSSDWGNPCYWHPGKVNHFIHLVYVSVFCLSVHPLESMADTMNTNKANRSY